MSIIYIDNVKKLCYNTSVNFVQPLKNRVNTMEVFKMKKLLASALSILMAGAMLTACGDSDSSTSSKKDSSKADSTAESTTEDESKEETTTTTEATTEAPAESTPDESEPEPAADDLVYDPEVPRQLSTSRTPIPAHGLTASARTTSTTVLCPEIQTLHSLLPLSSPIHSFRCSRLIPTVPQVLSPVPSRSVLLPHP